LHMKTSVSATVVFTVIASFLLWLLIRTSEKGGPNDEAKTTMETPADPAQDTTQNAIQTSPKPTSLTVVTIYFQLPESKHTVEEYYK